MHIKLPDFLIADLYKDTLINAKIESAATVKQAFKYNKKWFLGDNKKNITILIYNENAEFLNTEAENLLTGILNACQLSFDDVAIVNFQKTPVSHTEIAENFQAKKLIAFDINPSQIQLPFTIPRYQIQQYNGCTYLFASALSTMLKTIDSAKEEKQLLWNCLKKVFEI